MPLETPLRDYTPSKISSWTLQDIPTKSKMLPPVHIRFRRTKRRIYDWPHDILVSPDSTSTKDFVAQYVTSTYGDQLYHLCLGPESIGFPTYQNIPRSTGDIPNRPD